jgi:hypothetical protein
MKVFDREKMIARCVDDLAESAANDSRFARDIFLTGFVGFRNMSDEELKQAYADAGLDEQYDD